MAYTPIDTVNMLTGATVDGRKLPVLRALPAGADAEKSARKVAQAAVRELRQSEAFKAYSNRSNAVKAARKLDVAQVVERSGQWGVLTYTAPAEVEVEAPTPLPELDAFFSAGVEAVEAAPTPVAPVAATGHRLRDNRKLPEVLTALRTTAGGVTLDELTAIAGWRMPFEVANLRILEKKHAAGATVKHDGAAGAARRYWLA